MSFKVPMDRIAVIIGKDGSVRQRLEGLTGTEIFVDSTSGLVVIKKKGDVDVPIGDWIAQNMIKAIARGFNPSIAEKLMDDDYLLEIIDMERLVGGSKKNLTRVKSRLIGESGKTWKNIETLAEVHMSIYGNTLSLIGQYDEMKVAREAINKLIEGQNHASVYKFLQKKHEELKRKRMTELWKPFSGDTLRE